MVYKVSDFDLISGRHIPLQGIGIIRQLTLADIRDIGLDAYYKYLSLITINMRQMADLFDLKSEYITEEITPFDIFTLDENIAGILIEALSIFFEERLEFSPKHHAILTIPINGRTQGVGRINRDNFIEVKTVIMALSRITETEPEKPKCKNSKALKRIEEQLAKGRAKMQASKRKTRESENTALWNVVGAVAACSTTYNLTNIWELTIAQLYDQFYRINNRYYLDIMSTRWCAWGEGEFKLDPWYGAPSE